MADDFNFDPFDDDTGRVRQRVGGLVLDVIRKTVSQGVEARNQTEETIRNIVGEVKLPREIATVVLQQADQVKSEVVRVVAGEVRNFLDEANIGEEVARILTSLSFEVRTEIRFIPNDEKLKPSVKSKVGLKSQAVDGTEFLDEEETRVLDRAIRRGVTNILSSKFLNRVLGQEEDLEPEEEETPKPARAKRAAPSTGAKPKPTAKAKATVAKPKASGAASSTSAKPKTATSAASNAKPRATTTRTTTARAKKPAADE